MTARALCMLLLVTFMLPHAAAQQENACCACRTPCEASTDACNCGHCDDLCDRFQSPRSRCGTGCFDIERTPAMIGDFFLGSRTRVTGSMALDRLMVVADDLDSPAVLPPSGSTLTITEPGPVGIFDTPLTSVQEIQTLLRAGSPLPPGAVVGTIADNATMTTAITVGQIQALLASTPQAYDIVPLVAPPGTYDAAVAAVFAGRNVLPGNTVLDSNASGAMLQGGVDTLTGGEDFDAFYFYEYQAAANLLIPQVSGGGVGRLKIAEGGSVLPQDRLYFRYSYIDDVAYHTNGVGLSRFTPGFERSFYDGLFSFELRAPFASSTVSDVSTNGTQSFGSTDAQFGNLTMYIKALLYQRNRCAISGGLGIEVPTADDVSVTVAGTPLLQVDNGTTYLQPFLGMLHYCTDNLFHHGFVQFDIAAGGNDVRVNSGTGLSLAGSLSERDNIFIDYGVGYWLLRDNSRHGLTGIIPTVEFHHTSSISGANTVSAGAFAIGNSGSTSLTNIVAGTTLEFGRRTQVSLAYAGELDNNDLSDGAFRLMLSHLH